MPCSLKIQNQIAASLLTTIKELKTQDQNFKTRTILVYQSQFIPQVMRNLQLTQETWLYPFADIARANELIRTIEWDEQFQSGNVDECVSEWCSVYLQVMEWAIPQKLVKDKHSLPLISKNVIKPIRKQKKLYQKYKMSNLSIHKAQYQHQRNHTLSLLLESKNNYMQQLNTRDSKKYWKVVKSLNKSGTSKPTLVVTTKRLRTPRTRQMH